MTSRLVYSATLAFSLIITGCGGGSGDAGDGSSSAAGDQSGLSSEQMEHGIGPIAAFELGELNADMATKGEEVFKIKCSACHKTDSRYIGPELGTVLDRRSPAYVMNMILNPEQMLAEHPEARAMLAEYMTPMANQNLTEEEARAILEYLRTAPRPAE